VRDLPFGTVTFLFTDVEGSTQLLRDLGAESYASALAEHRRVLRETFAHHGGVEVDTQGDAFFVAFPTAPGALAAAAEAQRGLSTGPISVRMGLHTGTPLRTSEGYVGTDVHRAARIAAAGHGGQVLLSSATRALVDGEGLRDLGEHRLKDLTAPERLFQIGDRRFPPLKTLYRTNLPVPATPFLGRAEELREVVSFLQRDDVGLVTLTGAGGTGKTRLALQAVAEAAEAFPDGTTWVPLAPLRESGPVLETIANALDIQAEATRSLADTLVDRLTGSRCLVLLDNAEHLLPAIATDVGRLRAAQGLKLLVTSRERLRLQGEQVWPVPPLDHNDGVELFAARARALDPSFEPSATVPALCERLDNLPLALELAAARTPLFTPDELMDRLGQRLDLLTGGRDVDPRQQTLRATIAWSYDLLDGEEQRLLRGLVVFAGGCTYEAAEAICGAEPDTLQSLLDKSLVRRRAGKLGPRYWMLEAIREFAGELSAACGEEATLRGRHAEWFLARSKQAVSAADGDEVTPWNPVAWLQDELPNLRAAFEWAFEQGETRIVHSLAAYAGSAWAVSGAYAEGRSLLTRVLNESGPMPPREHAWTLHTLGGITGAEADFHSAQELQEQALGLFQRDSHGGGVLQTTLSLVWIAGRRGQLNHGRDRLAEARGAARPGSDIDRARICLAEANLEGSTGAFARAQMLTDEGIALLARHGRPRAWDIHELISVGWWAINAGDFARARSALEDYLGDDSPTNPHGIANAHGNLGLIALYEGDRDTTVSHVSEQLSLIRATGAKETVAEGLYSSAAVAAIDGESARALRLWGGADRLKRAMGSPLSRPEQFIVDRYLEPLQAQAEAEQLKAEGAAMSIDDAIALALEMR
jgi:predicted ATPase/class 3 adenylate cyclase